MDRTTDLEGLADAPARVFLRRIYEAGDAELTPMVHCPRRAEAVSIDICRSCEKCLGLSIDRGDRSTFLRCTQQGGAAPVLVQREITASQEELAVGGRGRSARDIMVSPIATVSTTDDLTHVAALFVARGISATPVVDETGTIVGVISKTDIVQRYYEDDSTGHAQNAERENDDALEYGSHVFERGSVTAGSVMTPLVMAVPEDAPISRVAALMAYEGIHHIIVHDSQHAPIGIISSLDIIAWLARTDGYVVPRTDRPGHI